MNLKIGTRKSDLALFQTRLVKNLLDKHFQSEIIPITTRGDKNLDPLSKIPGDGFFTKELEHQLLENEIDLAVHSCKDLSSQQHMDLIWKSVDKRESSLDVLITKKENIIQKKPVKLKPNLKIGSSSPRRKHQLENLDSTIKVIDIRGNVPTRIAKLMGQDYDGIVLAEAGINRLKLKEFIQSQDLDIVYLPFVTAPCQGILAVQSHNKNISHIEKISNAELTELAYLEKEVLTLLGGGCHLACGAEAQKSGEDFVLKFYYYDHKEHHNFEIREPSGAQLLRSLIKKLCKNISKKDLILMQSLPNCLKTAKAISDYGFNCIAWSTRDILPSWKKKDLQKILQTQCDSIVFTSSNAVRIFFQDLLFLNTDLLMWIKSKKIFSVGKTTQNSLSEYGLESSIPNEFHADSLFELLSGHHPLVLGVKNSILVQKLIEKKRPHHFIEIYSNVKSNRFLSRLPDTSENSIFLITSPSQAEDFIGFVKNSQIQYKKVYALGPSTAEKLSSHSINYTVSKESGNLNSILEIIKKEQL